VNTLIDKIAFIVPTRGRPGNVAGLSVAFDQTSFGYADLHFVVDGDHPEEHDYTRASGRHSVHYQPWRGLSGTLNTASVHFAKAYRYVGFMGDDHRPRTHGFDASLYGALRRMGDHAVAYGPDGQADYSHIMTGPVTEEASHVPMTWWVMDSQTIRLLGQHVPYVLSHTCVDDYVWQLGYQSETLTYVSGALVEHLHPVWGKAKTDESYELSSEHNNRLADHRKWAEYQKTQLPRDVRLIKMSRGTPG
jgi:hypothetical protein